MRFLDVARRIVREFSHPFERWPRPFRPHVETLERRDVPASYLWIDALGNHDGHNPRNWDKNDFSYNSQQHEVPGAAGDVVYFGSVLDGSTGIPVGSSSDCYGLPANAYWGIFLSDGYKGTAMADDKTSATTVQLVDGHLVGSGDFSAGWVDQTSFDDHPSGTLVVEGNATITTHNIANSSAEYWGTATITTLTQTGGSVGILEGGGTVGTGHLSGGSFEADTPVTAHALTVDGADVFQEAGADLTVDQTFSWTLGDVNADGNAATLRVSGANATGTIAPQGNGTLLLGSTLEVGSGAIVTALNGTVSCTTNNNINIDEAGTLQLEGNTVGITIYGKYDDTNGLIQNWGILAASGKMGASSKLGIWNQGGGTVEITTNTTVTGGFVTGLAGDPKVSVVQSGDASRFYIRAGYKLVVPNGFSMSAGLFAVRLPSVNMDNRAQIEGTMYVYDGVVRFWRDSNVEPIANVGATLEVTENVTWSGGGFVADLNANANADNQLEFATRWASLKTMTISATSAKLWVNSINASRTPVNRMYQVLFAEDHIEGWVSAIAAVDPPQGYAVVRGDNNPTHFALAYYVG
jgi:hypothetical protein